MTRRNVLGTVALIGALAAVTFAVTAGASGSTSAAVPAPPTQVIPTRPVVLPAMPCSQVVSADFSQIPGAPTSVTGATLVGTGSAQYCDVSGFIAPQTQFELRLPTSTYQDRISADGLRRQLWHGVDRDLSVCRYRRRANE